MRTLVTTSDEIDSSGHRPRSMLAPMSTTTEVSRRGFLSGLGALAATGAVGAGQLLAAPAAEAATGDPVLHLLRRATYGPTPALLAKARRMGRAKWLDQQLHPGQIKDSASGMVRRWPRLNWSSATVHGALKIGLVGRDVRPGPGAHRPRLPGPTGSSSR